MKKGTKRILAINPGSRYLGLALFNGSELKEWMVKTLQYKSLRERLCATEEILYDLIEHEDIDMLVIKKLHPSRSSPNLQKLTDRIKKVAEIKNLAILEYPLSTIKQFFFPSVKSNKKALIEEMTLQYSFLHRVKEKEKKNRNKYFVRMFEAVALGTLFISQL